MATFNTKLNKAIETAQAKVEKAQEKALDKLLENDKLNVEFLKKIEDLKKLIEEKK